MKVRDVVVGSLLLFGAFQVSSHCGDEPVSAPDGATFAREEMVVQINLLRQAACDDFIARMDIITMNGFRLENLCHEGGAPIKLWRSTPGAQCTLKFALAATPFEVHFYGHAAHTLGIFTSGGHDYSLAGSNDYYSKVRDGSKITEIRVYP